MGIIVNLSDQKIKTLRSALSDYMTENIYELDLSETELVEDDLSVLADFPTLVVINLSGMILEGKVIDSIKNIPFNMLSNLKEIYIKYTEISDLKPLEICKKLQLIDAEGSPISSIDALKDLNDLEILHLAGTKVSNISLLKNHTRLSQLSLSDCPINDSSLDTIATLTHLKKLFLKDVEHISSHKLVSSLSDLLALEELEVDYDADIQSAKISILANIRNKLINLGSMFQNITQPNNEENTVKVVSISQESYNSVITSTDESALTDDKQTLPITTSAQELSHTFTNSLKNSVDLYAEAVREISINKSNISIAAVHLVCYETIINSAIPEDKFDCFTANLPEEFYEIIIWLRKCYLGDWQGNEATLEGYIKLIPRATDAKLQKQDTINYISHYTRNVIEAQIQLTQANKISNSDKNEAESFLILQLPEDIKLAKVIEYKEKSQRKDYPHEKTSSLEEKLSTSDAASFNTKTTIHNKILTLNLANQLIWQKRFQEALNLLNDLLTLVNNYESNNDSIKAHILNNIGVVYTNLGEYQKALVASFQACEIREQLSTLPDNLLAGSYCNIANVYHLLQDYDQAVKWQSKSLAIKEKLYQGYPNPDLVQSLTRLGFYQSVLANSDQKNFILALNHYKKAIFYAEKLPLHLAQSTMIVELYALCHNLFFSKSPLKQALHQLREFLFSLHPSFLINKPLAKLYIHIRLADLYLNNNILKLANSEIQEIIKNLNIVFSKQQTNFDIVVSLQNLSSKLFLRKQFSILIEFENELIQTYMQTKVDDELTAVSYNNLGSALFVTGRLDEAFASYKKAEQLIDSNPSYSLVPLMVVQTAANKISLYNNLASTNLVKADSVVTNHKFSTSSAANAKIKEKHYRAALNYFLKIVIIQNKFPQLIDYNSPVNIVIANLYEKLGNIDVAIHQTLLAINLTSSLHTTNLTCLKLTYNLGRLYELKNNITLAKTCFEKALITAIPDELHTNVQYRELISLIKQHLQGLQYRNLAANLLRPSP